jgi:pentatricopeptide repeat protein
MYAKCGVLEKAQTVLEGLRTRNIVSWCALMAGYTQLGKCHEAILCFDQMQSEGISPNLCSFIAVLKACGNIQAVDKTREVHDQIVSKDFLKKDIILGAVLVDTYGKCGFLQKAQQVLEELHLGDSISSFTLIGEHHQALEYFEWTESEHTSREAIAFRCILNACAVTGAIDKGKQIHDEIAGRGLLGSDIALDTALMDMYIKCGVLTKAQ